MTRLTKKQYQRHVIVAMLLYAAFMMLLWPLVRTDIGAAWKIVLSLTGALPVIYVIAMMARHIRDSDELEQRTHLIGLGVATMVVGVLSVVGGFLASSGVWRMDASTLIWVFPVMMISYAMSRGWAAKRYGTSMVCDEESGVPKYVSFLASALVLFVAAFIGRHALNDENMGMIIGMASTFAVGGVVLGVLRWRSRQHQPHGER